MELYKWYIKPWTKYQDGSGRAPRKEFWTFFLVNLSIRLALEFIDPKVALVFGLVILLPQINVGIRRLHDAGYSGWFLLIPIVNLVLMAKDGERGDNRFGSDPKIVLDGIQCSELDLNDANDYNSRGNGKKAQGDLDGAISDYSKAIELDPYDSTAYNNRGEARKAKGDLAGAAEDFAQAAKLQGTLI